MKPHKIARIYAWIVTDAAGEDGIPALRGKDGAHMPMIGSDKARIEFLRPWAEALAITEGFPLRLVEFSQMVVLEEIPPPPGAPIPKHRQAE